MDDDELRTTPLLRRHERAGAKLAAFAGWRMPIRFGGTLAEHEAVRTDVGVFDVSHLGTVWVEGPEALEVIDAAFTNDPARLDDGGAQYTLCCDPRAGIVDDLIVYRIRRDRWLAIPNAANTPAVRQRLEVFAAHREAAVHDESGSWAVLAVQGPRALPLLDAVTSADGIAASAHPDAIDSFGVAELVSEDSVGYLARTGYTGEAGGELVVPSAWAGTLWDAIVEQGATPCGLAARDTLRLEAGLPLHGNELSPEVSPDEARLGWAVALDRGGFVGAEAIAAARDERQDGAPARRLWGLVVDGRRPARADMEVVHDGRVVGRTTSGTLSPTLGVPIALAYLERPLGPGDRVALDLRGRLEDAEVIRPPFLP